MPSDYFDKCSHLQELILDSISMEMTRQFFYKFRRVLTAISNNMFVNSTGSDRY